MFHLWIDIAKARRGEHVGGKYVLRWWRNDRWNYKYSDLKNRNHGPAATATEEHTVTTHPQSLKEGHSPEKAFHHARNQALKGDQEHTAIIRSPEGAPKYKVVVRPSADRPIMILPPGTDKAREAITRLPSFEALENWSHRERTVRTVLDAHGKPWFDVRERGRSGIESPSDRMTVRYYSDSPYNPFPDEPSKWVPSPFGTADTEKEWVSEQHRQQRASGQRVKPAKRFPIDKERPVTTALEHARVTWKRVPRPYQTTIHRKTGAPWQRRGRRWVRQAQFRSEEERNSFYSRVIREHFGQAVLSASRQLRMYNLFNQDNMARLLGYYGGPGRSKKIEIEAGSPTLKAVERAVNSYDPEKGWKFSTYLSHCLWWEHFREVKNILTEVRERRKMITTMDHGGHTHDIFEFVDRQMLLPGHESIIGTGAHTRTPEESIMAKQDELKEWSSRQEDRLARFVSSASDDHDKQVTAFLASHELHEIRTPEQAQGYIVHWQSEGGDEFIEPFEKDEVEKPRVKVSSSEKSSWVSMVKEHPLLTSVERAALLSFAPRGDLQNLRPFPEVALELSKKHSKEFSRPPTESQLVDIFLSAHHKLAGLPEFEAMQAKLSPVAKAINLLRRIGLEKLARAAEILSKAKKGARAPSYKYWRREGNPGHYKYFYRDQVGNVIQGTNAPVGHDHHDKKMGQPDLHPDEPDPGQNPEYFDPNGKKMNRAVPGHAEWNQAYNKDVPLNRWAARWRADPNDETSHHEHAYYDSDLRERDELKFNQDNKHFDEQLPKIRKMYSTLMQSKQLPYRALGLMIALLDQAHMRAGRKVHEQERGTLGLTSLKVGNVKIKGNTATFSYPGKLGVDQQQMVTLDRNGLATLQELISAPGKKRTDYLFAVPVRHGDKVTFQEIGYNKLRRTLATLGVTPKQFRTYHGTEIFSQVFEHLHEQIKGRITTKVLEQLTQEAALEAAKALGHYIGKGTERKAHAATALRSYIDPVVVQTLWMNAINPDVQKSHSIEEKVKYDGVKIDIENKKGSTRKWYDPNEDRNGKQRMHYDYGFIVDTEGVDGDEVDVYIGPKRDSDQVFIIRQMKGPDFKKFDEDKVMLGFKSAGEAKAAYMKQYDDPRFFGGMKEMSLDDLKEKIKDKSLRGKMIKSIEEPEKGDDDGVAVHSVVSNPPDRFESEQAFSEWMHSHPLHETDHEWEALKQLSGGKLDLHTPELDHEESDNDNDGAELDPADSGGPQSMSGVTGAWDGDGGDEEVAQQPDDSGGWGAPAEGQDLQQGGEGSLRQDQGEVRSPSPT